MRITGRNFVGTTSLGLAALAAARGMLPGAPASCSPAAWTRTDLRLDRPARAGGGEGIGVTLVLTGCVAPWRLREPR